LAWLNAIPDCDAQFLVVAELNLPLWITRRTARHAPERKRSNASVGYKPECKYGSRLSHLPNEFFIAKMHSWPLAEQLNGEYDIKSLKSRTLEKQGGPYADEED
jgi:hypothetical protein